MPCLRLSILSITLGSIIVIHILIPQPVSLFPSMIQISLTPPGLIEETPSSLPSAKKYCSCFFCSFLPKAVFHKWGSFSFPQHMRWEILPARSVLSNEAPKCHLIHRVLKVEILPPWLPMPLLLCTWPSCCWFPQHSPGSLGQTLIWARGLRSVTAADTALWSFR